MALRGHLNFASANYFYTAPWKSRLVNHSTVERSSFKKDSKLTDENGRYCPPEPYETVADPTHLAYNAIMSRSLKH